MTSATEGRRPKVPGHDCGLAGPEGGKVVQSRINLLPPIPGVPLFPSAALLTIRRPSTRSTLATGELGG